MNTWKNQEKGMPMPVSESSSVKAAKERGEAKKIRQGQQEKTEITTEQAERLRRNSEMKDSMATELASMGFSPGAVSRILHLGVDYGKPGSSLNQLKEKGGFDHE